MNLELDPTIAQGYKSKGYIAGLVTEAWAALNLYCLACSSEKLVQEKPNSPVRDFHCPGCSATYQLKGKNGRYGRKVPNSAYAQKISAIDQGAVPHYAFLNYDRSRWKVTDLFVVPGHLLGRSAIQRRNPLGPQAKRAGWTGSNILLNELPEEGRIQIVLEETVREPEAVRREWSRVAFLGTDRRARGWGSDVYMRVKRLVDESGSREFTLEAFVRRYLAELSELHPENHNVAAKIRQQMQVLRDGALLEFVDYRGWYRLLG